MSEPEESSAANAAKHQREAAAVAQSNNDDDDIDSEDEDEIQEYYHRFLFQEYRFGGPVWQGLQDAGWTHQSGIYQSPGGMVFSSGKQICQYLDKFCIAPIDNTLQLPPENPLSEMTLEEIRIGEALRMNVVRKVFKRMTALSKRGKQQQDEEEESNTKTAPVSIKSSRERRQGPRFSAINNKSSSSSELTSRRRSSRLAQEQTKTSTAFEKGADTFLRKSRDTKSTRSVTSQEMAFLKFPTVKECVSQFRDSARSEIQQNDEYTKDFDDWKFLLSTQHSLLLYGFGSKRKLLDWFARDKLEEEGDVLTIDGFDRDVRMEAILDLIVNHFLDGVEPSDKENRQNTCHDRVGITVSSMIATHEVVRRATRIARSLAVKQKKQRRPIYLVLHNIDGPNLSSRDIQEALAALVAHSNIDSTSVHAVRMVASIDHVNASALLWDNRTSANFAWIYKEVHTYHPYVDELAVGVVEDERKRHRSKKRQADDMEDQTLWNVLASLAPRHGEVVKILATLQSEDSNNKPVGHAALLRNCKHKMTVTNDSTLRAYLTELKDHGIVETGKDSNTGREWLRIPHSGNKLLEIRDFEMES